MKEYIEKVVLLFKEQEHRLGELGVDAFLSETHRMSARAEELCIERDGHTSASLHFSCTAKQIRMVNQKRLEIPEPKTARAKPKQKKGLQETKAIPAERAEVIKKQNSLLNTLFGG